MLIQESAEKMEGKANSDNEGTKRETLIEPDTNQIDDEVNQQQPKMDLRQKQTSQEHSKVNLVDSKGVLYTKQDSQLDVSPGKGRRSKQGFQASKGSLNAKPPINKSPSKSRTPLGVGSSSAQIIPKLENQDLKELDTLDEVNSQEQLKIQKIKKGLQNIDIDSHNKTFEGDDLSDALTPRAVDSSLDVSTAKKVNANVEVLKEQISIFDGGYNQQQQAFAKLQIEDQHLDHSEDQGDQGSDSPIRIRKQPFRELESASHSNIKASTMNFNQSASDIGNSTKIAPDQVHQSGRDSSTLQNYTPFKQNQLGQEFRTPNQDIRNGDFESQVQTDVKLQQQSNQNQQVSSNQNLYSINSPMSLQPQGIQRMEVNITKKDSFDNQEFGVPNERTHLFSSNDSGGANGLGNIEISNEGLSGWHSRHGAGPIRQQHFRGKFIKRTSKDKKDEKQKQKLAIQEAKFSIGGVQGNNMKLHALPSLSHAIAQQKIMEKKSKNSKRRKRDQAETRPLSEGSQDLDRGTGYMKNQDINMMTATFNAGNTMNSLEKTLYFNNRDHTNADQSSFEGNDIRADMNLTSDMKVSSLLQNKKLEDLIIDENSLSGNTALITAQATPNLGMSQTPIEFSNTLGPGHSPQQSPTVLKVNQQTSDGTDLKLNLRLQNSAMQQASGEDLGPVNQPQNIRFQRNVVETFEKDRATNNETPNISNPNFNIGPRYNELSQSQLIAASEGNYKPGTIYQYDGYDSQSLEQIQLDPMAQLNQLNQIYQQQPQFAEYFNGGGVNILPDHQYPHQVHSAMRAKNLNLDKKKISMPSPFGEHVDPKTSRAQFQLLEQLWKQETQQNTERVPSKERDLKEFSQSITRFKQSILNSQIKMNADPNRWMPTGSLIHQNQKESENKHLAPPSFRIQKINNNARDSSVDRSTKKHHSKSKPQEQNSLMPICQSAKLNSVGPIHKHPTSFISSFVAGGSSETIGQATNSPHVITQVGQHNMISVFSSIHDIIALKEKSPTKKSKKAPLQPQGLRSQQQDQAQFLQGSQRVGSQLREDVPEGDQSLGLQGGNPQNTQTGTTIHFGNEHVFQSKSSGEAGAFMIETNLGTIQTNTKAELHQGLTGDGMNQASSGMVSAVSPQPGNRQYYNASWTGVKNHSTMRNEMIEKPISEAAAEETHSKPQSAMRKESITVRAKNTQEAAKGSKGQVLQPILQPIMGGRGSDYEGQLLQEQVFDKKRSPQKTSKQISLIQQLDLQSKLNLHSSNHSGELMLQDTHGSLPGLVPKGFRHQDYVAHGDSNKLSPTKKNSKRGVQMRKYVSKKQSTVYSSREGGPQRRETGSSKLTYRGNLGKSKGSKGNEDLSHFLGKSAQRRENHSKGRLPNKLADQESLQRLRVERDNKAIQQSALRQTLKSQATSDDKISQHTDPKYRLDPNTGQQQHPEFQDNNSILPESMNEPGDQTSNQHSSINYTFINYQEQREEEAGKLSKKNRAAQSRPQPYVLDRNSPYQTVHPSPTGLTSVSQNHKHLFANNQRADKVYLQQASSLDQKRKHKEFYMKRFSNIDQMVAIMTKGRKKGKQSPEDSVLTPEGEAKTQRSGKTKANGSPHNRNSMKERSSSGSAGKTGSNERGTHQDRSFYFQGSTRNAGSIALPNQTRGAFDSKDSSYFGKQTQRGGRQDHPIKMNGVQKFGDKKNTTQIFSSTVQIENTNRRDEKTYDPQTPYDRHPFTPSNIEYPKHFDIREDGSTIATPFNAINNQNGMMNMTANDFNPMLLAEDKPGMAVTSRGGFGPQQAFNQGQMNFGPQHYRYSPLQLQLNNQVAIQDSAVSASASQGSQGESFMQNAIKRMNRLENKINVKDSMTMDSVNNEKASYDELDQEAGSLPKLKGTSNAKKREGNEADTRQLLRTLNLQEKLLQNLQLKEQLQYQRLVTQNTQHKNFNFTQANGFGKAFADQLSPSVDFQNIRQELKESLRSKDKVIIPQQSTSKPKRKFGSIQATTARIGGSKDGASSVAQEDLFRKKVDVTQSRSVKTRPEQGAHFSNNKRSLQTQINGYHGQRPSLMTQNNRNLAGEFSVTDTAWNKNKEGTLSIPTAGIENQDFKQATQKFDPFSHSMSFSPVPTARQGIPTPFSGELSLKPPGMRMPKNLPLPIPHDLMSGGDEEQYEQSTKQDFSRIMMQQMNTSTYRAKFNPNHTQDSFGFNPNGSSLHNGRKAQSSKLKAPKGVLRQLSNQRGDNVGFTTAYNFKEKLLQDPNATMRSGKPRKDASLNRQITIKKTIDLIGDYYGKNSTKQVQSQIGQKQNYNTKDTVYKLDTSRQFQTLSGYEQEMHIQRNLQGFQA